jgi:hypothetical protein
MAEQFNLLGVVDNQRYPAFVDVWASLLVQIQPSPYERSHWPVIAMTAFNDERDHDHSVFAEIEPTIRDVS